MHAESHADRSVDDLCGDSVAIHIGDPRAAAVGALANFREFDSLGALNALPDAAGRAVFFLDRSGVVVNPRNLV
jgi:hypothetical protein